MFGGGGGVLSLPVIFEIGLKDISQTMYKSLVFLGLQGGRWEWDAPIPPP